MNSSILSRTLAALGYLLLAVLLFTLTVLLLIPVITWAMSRGADVAPPGLGWVLLMVGLLGFLLFRLVRRMTRILRGAVPAWSWHTGVVYVLSAFLLLQISVALPYFFRGQGRSRLIFKTPPSNPPTSLRQ